MTKEEKILLIMQLAYQITKADIAHVHVQFAAHITELTITIEPADTDYQDSTRALGTLLREEFYVGKREHLNDETADAHLDRVIQKLEDLKSKEATC